MSKPSSHEKRYLKLLLDPLEECAHYQPKFGTDDAEGVSLERFQEIYGQDPFYHWLGMDSPLMYAAHKAAGGMTSVYRQIGAGCDSLFRAVVQDSLGLSAEQVQWSYEIEKEDKTKATLTLDARIDLAHVENPDARKQVRAWLDRCGKKLGLPVERIEQIRGAVFEARQGYKSADAKRQNESALRSQRRCPELPAGAVHHLHAGESHGHPPLQECQDAGADRHEDRQRRGEHIRVLQERRGIRVGRILQTKQ
ncbi:MAG: hypothetical protein JNM56_04840 [Planctomycetia bacterium]|nr:hypothetical protein [Planctomycetia bacterium]